MSANGLHRIRWRRVAVTRVHRTHPKSVRERLSKYTSKWFCAWGGKCRQTDSIGSDGDGLPWPESIGLTASQFARDLVKYTSKWCCAWGGKGRQTDSIGSDGDGLPFQDSIGLTASLFARDLTDLVNIHQSGVVAGVENVGKRTDSIGSDEDGLPWQDSIRRGLSQFARDLVNIQSWVVFEGIRIYRQTDCLKTRLRFTLMSSREISIIF